MKKWKSRNRSADIQTRCCSTSRLKDPSSKWQSELQSSGTRNFYRTGRRAPSWPGDTYLPLPLLQCRPEIESPNHQTGNDPQQFGSKEPIIDEPDGAPDAPRLTASWVFTSLHSQPFPFDGTGLNVMHWRLVSSKGHGPTPTSGPQHRRPVFFFVFAKFRVQQFLLGIH